MTPGYREEGVESLPKVPGCFDSGLIARAKVLPPDPARFLDWIGLGDTRAQLAFIVFTLDESTYSRELAPLAGHYPAMKLGPPWWSTIA